MRKLLLASLAVVLAAATAIAVDANARGLYGALPPVGEPVPAFDLPLVDGGRISPGSLRGAPTLLVLWSSTCPASQLALDGVEGLHRDYAARGVRLVVLADDDDPRPVRALLRGKGSIQAAYASGELEALLDPARRPWQRSFGLPSFVLLDAQGRVADVAVGVPGDEAASGEVRLSPVRAMLDRSLGGV